MFKFKIGLVNSTSRDRLRCVKFKLPMRKPAYLNGSMTSSVARRSFTRHGRAIARLVPEVGRRQEEVDRALASIRELRKRTLKISLEEILSAKEEGRKY